MATQTLNTLLEKADDWDKDERYMATSDLCNELQKDIKIDAAMEQRICAAILKRLDDQSNDVQSKAIQCLGILLKKVQEGQVYEICEKLCELILDGKDELRDVYSIGLKTLVADVPEQSGRGVARRLIQRLLAGITGASGSATAAAATSGGQKDKSLEIKLECLDCLADLLRRFGHEIEEDHSAVVEALMAQLTHDKSVVRKKATACLGAAAVVLSDPLLNELTEGLLAQIRVVTEQSAAVAASDKESTVNNVRTLIQTVGAISRTVGYRLGRHLDAIVPLFLQYMGDPEDESLQTDAVSELRETILQAFESFVLRCSREITPHLTAILDTALTYMKYDPNYNYGDEEDAMEEEEEEWEDEEGYEDEFLDEEDDDTSWKVRRAAIKVLSAVISSRPEMLTTLFDRSGRELVGRFKEREENVRLDIIDCFTGLVRMTVLAEARTSGPDAALLEGGDPMSTDGGPVRSQAAGMLEGLLPQAMAVALKQLSGKADKSKSAVFALLKVLVTVVSEALTEHMPQIVPCVVACLTDKNQSLKLDALIFVRLAMEHQTPTTFQPHMPQLLPLVLALVREEWYKVIAEALRVVRVMITVMRPLDEESGMFVGDFDFAAHVEPIYSDVLPRLEATDIDHEIKECAITTVGQLAATFGDQLTGQLPTIEALLMERLANEITRVPVLKALVVIATSPLRLDLSPILNEAIQALAQFLRQQSRALKQTTLETLMALIESSSAQMDGALFALVLAEAAPLISDADLHLTHLSLRLTIAVLAVSPAATHTVADHVMPRVLVIAASSLLQGRALDSLLELLREFVALDAPRLGFDELYTQIQSRAAEVGQRQGVANVAHCLATLCVRTTPERRQQAVQNLVQHLNGPEDSWRLLALLTIGELGQFVDLSGVDGSLQHIVLGAFESPAEETKTAAAYALGRMAVGNMQVYLPLVLESLGHSRHHYLLLSALKEVIVLHANTPDLDFTPYLDQVLPHLFQHCESPEEGVRNMVAECLGALMCTHPDRIVPSLTKLGADASEVLMRWTIATSLKYCMTGRAPRAVLLDHMDTFLAMLHDEDLGVRHATLQMCNAAVHHQPGLIVRFLAEQILPVLFQTCLLKCERSVDLGPFKQKVDDGLPLRKTALACINTILDTVPEQLNVVAFMQYLEAALTDTQPDVLMLCHQIVIKICAYAPNAVVGSLDGLVDPLEKTVMKKVKEGQVGTEVERANDLIRSGLRVVLAVAGINDSAGISRKFWDFMDRIHKKEKLVMMLEVIKAE